MIKSKDSKYKMSAELKGFLCGILDKKRASEFKQTMIQAEKTYQDMKNRRGKRESDNTPAGEENAGS